MTLSACDREAEVVRAALAGRWAAAGDDSLQGHVEACPVCREVAAVAALLAGDGPAARRQVRVPSAGQVWWRAAVRARLEATRAAARPMTLLHGIAAACALGLAAAGIGAAWPWIAARLADLGTRLSALPLGEIGAAAAGLPQHGALVTFGLAACLVLGPLFVYLALSDE
jgi:hypothetical protein